MAGVVMGQQGPSKADLQAALADLKTVVDKAQAAGKQTLYAEIPLTIGTRFVNTGWDAQRDDATRVDWAAYLMRQIQYEKAQLESVLAGKPEPRAVPPIPTYSQLQVKDNYFYLNGQPVLIVTNRNSGGEQGDQRYCGPGELYGIVSGVGATRYDFDQTPIWPLYQQDPKSHRVYDGGWCGHIIKDKWSIGGAGGQQGTCIISLDYPPMREAVRQAIVQKAQAFNRNNRSKRAKILSMDWEFTYQNYDDPSKVLWQKWLKDRYTTVAKLNEIWKTDLKTFEDVTLPPIQWTREDNPARYYDFGEFNLWRFTDYLLWARNVILKECPGWPITVGGGQPFGTDMAKQGIDEELLRTMGVVDVFLSETGSRSWGTAVGVDLVHSMDPKIMIHDPEYHSTGSYLPQVFFHGMSSADVYSWGSSGVNSTVPNGYALLRTCLDVRRLASYIVEFPKVSPEAALLYSRGSLLQRFPGTLGRGGVETPYTMELQKCYRAANQLDVAIGFVTTRQVKAGIRKDLRVLIIPGAYYENDDSVKQIMTFARDGGTLVVMPTSLAADEYNRRRDYLKNDLGVEIVKEMVPTYLAKKAEAGVAKAGSEYDFIQGPIAETVVADEPTATITWTAAGKAPAKTLAGNGIRQQIKVTGGTVLATFEDGTPAVVALKLGKGEVIYVAMQLEQGSTGELLDWVYDRAGVKRLARVTDPAGKPVQGLESRTVTGAQGTITYLYNMNQTTVKAVLHPAAPVSSIDDLTYARTVKPTDVFELGPFDYVVLKLNK